MDSKILFKKALEQATATLGWVDKSHFKNATPCTEWDCQTLVNHMLYELSWVPDLLEGKTVAQVGSKYDGDLLGHDHTIKWQKAADKAVSAVNKAKSKNKVHLSYGDRPVDHYIDEVGTDLLIHSWDTAQSYNCSLIMEPSLVDDIYKKAYPRRREYANSSLFGKTVKVPKNARPQTKLLAILGRKEPTK